tara:strand:- start:1964 stop:2770 length:807 start_codon:yes stop_codon:yes gene_type:complete
MDLEFIDNEISESRLYRSSGNMARLTGRDVADLAYLNTLVLYMMLQDDVQHDYAKQYAQKTSQYAGYSLFRTNATDLYLLCHVLKEPKTTKINLQNKRESIRFLDTLHFDFRKHLMFMKKLANSSDKKNEAVSFFFRLEMQLNIKDSKFKQYRRYVTDWGNLKTASRQTVVARILQSMRALGRGSELIGPMTSMTKYRKFTTEPAYDVPRTSMAQKFAGAAVGAVAGRYVGKKVAQYAKNNPDTVKKVGTGIGAIAGYWAAGRKKKQI